MHAVQQQRPLCVVEAAWLGCCRAELRAELRLAGRSGRKRPSSARLDHSALGAHLPDCIRRAAPARDRPSVGPRHVGSPALCKDLPWLLWGPVELRSAQSRQDLHLLVPGACNTYRPEVGRSPPGGRQAWGEAECGRRRGPPGSHGAPLCGTLGEPSRRFAEPRGGPPPHRSVPPNPRPSHRPWSPFGGRRHLWRDCAGVVPPRVLARLPAAPRVRRRQRRGA
mmetsp:Transcript_20372/g.56274  ORF Transcript_20372/g.56274 Transcript_20372/m.56274 type:complete len:223 (-) Transcript_20372:114-782(-)